MENKKLTELIESSHFIDDKFKEECKQYFKQIPDNLSSWVYSSSIPEYVYQGDVIDKVELLYQEVNEGRLEIRSFEDIPCILLSNTCDIDFEGKTRKKYISVAPVFDFEEFAKSRISVYSEDGWKNFLRDVRANQITDILYLPGKTPLNDSVVFLDRISSFDPELLKIKLAKNHSKRTLSLSQIGFYFFLIKLTYHFARYEDRSQIIRK